MTETQNSSSPKKVQSTKLKAKDTRKQELADIRSILDTKQGRRFIWKYLGECGVFRSSFSEDNRIYFNEGKRHIGLMLLAEIMEADEEMYLKMTQENKKQLS